MANKEKDMYQQLKNCQDNQEHVRGARKFSYLYRNHGEIFES